MWAWDSGLPGSTNFEARPSPVPRSMSSAILNLTCCHWSLQRGSSAPLSSGSSQRSGCCLCPQTGLCLPPNWCCPTPGWPSGPQTPAGDVKMNKTTKCFKAIYIRDPPVVPGVRAKGVQPSLVWAAFYQSHANSCTPHQG